MPSHQVESADGNLSATTEPAAFACYVNEEGRHIN